MKLELEGSDLFTPDMSNVPDRYVQESFHSVDVPESVQNFLVEYLKGFSHSGKDSLVLRPGELASKVFVALYRAVASRVTADCVRFWNWPAYSAWLRSQGWAGENELIDCMWGTRFLFLFDVHVEKDMLLLGTVVNDCISTNRKLFLLTRDDGFLGKLPEDVAQALDLKTLAVRIKDKEEK